MLETQSQTYSVAENITHLLPERCCEWEWNVDARQAIILVPRYRSKLISRIFGQRYTRMELDDYGTFVWEACTGQVTVSEIADKLREHFGEQEDGGDETLIERLTIFLRRLAGQNLVRFRKPTV